MSGGLLARVWANAFNPATLNMQIYYQGSYPGSLPWPGTASPGPSGGRPLATGGADPTMGSFSGARFVAANLNHGMVNLPVTTVFGPNGSGFALFRASLATADSGVAYGDGNIVADKQNAEIDVGFTTLGFGVCVLDNTVTYKRLSVPAGINTWLLGQWKYDGTNLKARVNAGAWSSLACGPYTPVNPNPNSFAVGDSYTNTFLSGDLVELASSKDVWTDAQFDQIRQYMNATYAGVGV